MAYNPQLWMQRLMANPDAILEQAQRGEMGALTTLGNFWERVPTFQARPERVIDIFLTRLKKGQVPKMHYPPSRPVPAKEAIFAFHSLMGLSKVGPFFDVHPTLLSKFTDRDTGLGIAAWLRWYFDDRVKQPNTDPRQARPILDILGGLLYAFGNQDALRPTIVAIPGMIEMAAEFWMREDEAGMVIDLPVGTLALGILLKSADKKLLDRIVNCQAVNGKPTEFANTALARLKKEMKDNSKHPRLADRLTIYMDFINSACRVPTHPIRHAFLAGGVIPTVCKALCFTSNRINPLKDAAYLDACVSGFGFLANVLESTDGFTWVKQAIQAGIFTTFVDCSPVFAKIPPEERKFILEVFSKVLPPYLVFPSVIKLCTLAIPKADDETRRQRIEKSVAKEVWQSFRKLAIERAYVLQYSKITKALACDNIKCQKSDHQKQFMACAACLTTYYCSQDCQKQAWKEGDHKTMCKLKQQEHLEGKGETISKHDIRFFHHLALRDARRHLPLLQRLVVQHPDLPTGTSLLDAIISIDYTRVPEQYKIKPLATYIPPTAEHRPNTTTRNDALIAKVKDHPGEYMLLESYLANGRGSQLLMTLASGRAFREDMSRIGGSYGDSDSITDDKLTDADWGEYNDEDGEGEGLTELTPRKRDTKMDEVDMMMARSALNGFLRAHRKEPAF